MFNNPANHNHELHEVDVNTALRARFILPRDDFCLDVDLRLPAAGVTVLFGHSGSGKTTLLRAIAGLERAAVGELQFKDEVWQAPKRWVPPHKRALAYVFQEASLFDHLTVAENLDYGRRRLRQGCTPMSDVDCQHIVELLELSPLMSRAPQQLSGGERQRVAIARALFSQPRLLLMDEPLAALDFARRQEVLGYLEKLRRELTIPLVYVTHSADELVRLADHVVVLERGRVAAEGDLQSVLADQQLLGNLSDEPFSLLIGSMSQAPEDERLVAVDVHGVQIRLPKQALQQTESVRLRLYAKDISISLSPATDSSILNILPCHITRLEEVCAGGQRLVHLKCQQQILLARLTDYSCEQLELQAGMAVFAQIKAASVVQ